MECQSLIYLEHFQVRDIVLKYLSMSKDILDRHAVGGRRRLGKVGAVGFEWPGSLLTTPQCTAFLPLGHVGNAPECRSLRGQSVGICVGSLCGQSPFAFFFLCVLEPFRLNIQNLGSHHVSVIAESTFFLKYIVLLIPTFNNK